MTNVSLFASAIRPAMWESCLESFNSTSVSFEVVFSGPCSEEEIKPFLDKYHFFRYLKTGNIKPAQCYEIARRACIGEAIVWFCDDAEAPNDVIGQAYKYWKSKNNEKLILSIQTKESGYNLPIGQLFDMNIHRLFAGDDKSPLMAPLALMSREFLNGLGGYDRRYVSGQTENDAVLRAYPQGATVEIFGDKDCYINIDHLGKSLAIGESKVEEDFLNRPFAKGYAKDREILEKSWCKFNQKKLISLAQERRTHINKSEIFDISPTQIDKFEPYAENISLTESESNKGIWQ